MKERADRLIDTALDIAEPVVLSVFAVICLFTFVLRTIDVTGESMEQTLFSGDKLIAREFMYTPERGDIVIAAPEAMHEVIVKRIIGVSGDVVEIDYGESAVYVNGERLSESYVSGKMHRREELAEGSFNKDTGRYVYKVPFGKYFLLGDNRDHSTDSRMFGFVDRDEIIGRAVLRIRSEKGSLGRIE